MEGSAPDNSAELAVRSPMRVALFVGRLIPWKGLLLAVESLKYAPDWKLVVLGEAVRLLRRSAGS